MGQINWTVSLVFIALFSFAIIGFALNFADSNDAAIDIQDDPEISGLYDDQSANLTSLGEDSEKTTESIISASIEEGGQTTASGGPFSITSTRIVGTTKNILLVGYTKIFGSDNGFGVFITSFVGLLVFITGLLIWKTWAGRNPE